MVPTDRCLGIRPGFDYCIGRDQPVQRGQVRRVRILVRDVQGRGNYRIYRAGHRRFDGVDT
ncbi:hypothetical protein D9M73_294220 [compost metagenome]